MTVGSLRSDDLYTRLFAEDLEAYRKPLAEFLAEERGVLEAWHASRG